MDTRVVGERELQLPKRALRVFRQLVDRDCDLIAVVDPQFRYRIVNPAYVPREGMPSGESAGPSVAELLGEELFQELVRPHLEGCFAGRDSSYAGWFTLPLFGRRYLEVRYYPLPGEERREQAVVVIRDLTQHRRSEESLQRRLELEETVSRISTRFLGLEDFDDAVDATLADLGRLSHAGRAYLFLLREGGATLDNTHEWCDEGVSPQIANLQGVPTAAFPWWMSRLYADETIHIADVSAMPAEAAAERALLESQAIRSLLVLPVKARGRLAGFIGFDNVRGTGQWRAEDVAILRLCSEILGGALERKAAEAERDALLARLREANQSLTVAILEARRRADELDATLNSMANGIVMFDAEGRITRINPEATRILGYTAENVRLPIQERLATLRCITAEGEPFTEDMAPVRRALRGETVYDVVMGVRRDSGITWTSTCGAPILSSEGRLLGAVVTFVDITCQHEFQEQRENLLRAVSHDLRTPLAVILGRAQMLRTLLGKPDKAGLVAESADSIVAGARRMLASIQDMVEVVRADSGPLRVEKQKMPLEPLLGNLAELVGPEASQRIRVKAAPDIPEVVAHRDYLERILTNLLTNALKYSKPETEILVRAEVREREVAISVADRGVGIAREHYPHLFKPFFRVPGCHQLQGLGLGLYVARMLVEALGGRIWVDSDVGYGSTFSFTLPSAQP